MAEKIIEKFYLFFQGIILFQAFFLGILYFITRKKDIVFYCIFLLLSAVYFFFNAPNTFFGLNDDIIFDSALYRYANIPLIIICNLFYLLFLKSFFVNLYVSKSLDSIFRFFLFITPLLVAAFFILRYTHRDTQPVFYIANFLSFFVSFYIIGSVLRYNIKNAGWVTTGMIFNILGTTLTILMIVLERYKIRNLWTLEYPLFFMRIGILADMFFYQVALLKKWHCQEKELAVQQLEQQLAIEKVRSQISRQLHDDIGSTLSGVSMYSHMANTLFENGEGEKGKASLLIIQKSANEIVGKLSDLVWSANPGQDSQQQLLERLHQYALDMCRTKNIQFKMENNLPAEIFYLPAEQRYYTYLVAKEAINNAVKYSNASLLELKATEKVGILEMTVSDNGKGFRVDEIKKGNGLNNMETRMKEIGATYNLYSKPGEGCTVSIQLKIT